MMKSSRTSRRQFLTGSAVALGAMAMPALSRADMSERDADLYLLGLEEHFLTPELRELNKVRLPAGRLLDALLDLGQGRLESMDKAGLNMAVLSAMTPGVQNLEGQLGIDTARQLNSFLAKDLVGQHPDRYRAFATLPLQSPEAAADELERSVEDGLVGAMTYGSINGLFLDDPIFDPVLARAAALNVPIYIHPASPPASVRESYYDRLQDDRWLSSVLGGAGYGWHSEVAIQTLRLIVSGAFDRHPNLQIVSGHMGEGLPFFYWRFGGDLEKAAGKHLEKPVQQYFHDNLWMTTSAFFQDELLELTMAVMGEDRVLFSTDYPFVTNEAATTWFRSVDLPRETKEKIGYKNAAGLLGIELK